MYGVIPSNASILRISRPERVVIFHTHTSNLTNPTEKFRWGLYRANSGTGFHFKQQTTLYLKWGGVGGSCLKTDGVQPSTHSSDYKLLAHVHCDTIQRFLNTEQRSNNWSTRHAHSSRGFFHCSKPPRHDAAHFADEWSVTSPEGKLVSKNPSFTAAQLSSFAGEIGLITDSNCNSYVWRLVACATVCAWRISICAQFFWHLQFLLSIHLWNPRVKPDIYRILERSLLVTQ